MVDMSVTYFQVSGEARCSADDSDRDDLPPFIVGCSWARRAHFDQVGRS